MMALLCLLVLLCYLLTILQLIWGCTQLKPVEFLNQTPVTFFSVVIPFRDEAQNLPSLLASLQLLDYPKDLFELIFIDDFSTDDSVKLLYKWRTTHGSIQTTLLENIRLSHSPKKDAITRAIPIVQQQWIVTTDADCTVPSTWLSSLDNFIRSKDANLVVGAVSYQAKPSFLAQFQLLDLLSLQGATQGSFGLGLGFMCNGANLAYTKSHFQALNGYAGNDKLASGDDVFLLQKSMCFDASKVQYLKSKSHLVLTKPEQSWKALLAQRVRWASKTGSYQSVFGKDLAVWVLLGNFSWLVLGALSITQPQWRIFFAAATFLKFSMDYLLIRSAKKNTSSKRLRYVFWGSLLYPFYCVFVALHAWPGTYTWKGRKLS